MKSAIKKLSEKSAKSTTAHEAMQFAQAALSLAHADATMKDTELKK